MTIIADQVEGNVEDAVRRAALAADRTAVLATPVDTGRARGNWRVGVGVPDVTANEDTDQGGGGAISRGRAVIAGWREGRGPIFISNSVPYIIPLDQGSSAQAPSGMSALAIQAARATLTRGNILLVGVR